MSEASNSKFWQGRRVLITGHTGFKGGWLALWLQSLGAKVYGFALAPPSAPSFFAAANVAHGITHTLGDLRDAKQVADCLQNAQPEIVFHLAAQALVRESYRDPSGTLATNVMGSVNLFEAIRQTESVRALLVVTSDKCYENREWLWPYRENEAMGGRDPYSASKGCVELITAAWRDSFLSPRVAVASARAGNVIGGGDWATDRLIPDALRAWSAEQALNIRSPHAVRPWQYQLDALAGYLMLATELLQTRQIGAWNFGPSDAGVLSVEAVLQELKKAWGSTASWTTGTEEQPHEATQLRLDSSKARNLLKWRNLFDIEQSAQAIVAWHHAWQGSANMRDFSLKQIDDYQSRLN